MQKVGRQTPSHSQESMRTKSKQSQVGKDLEKPGLVEGVPVSNAAAISSKNSNFIIQTELCGIKYTKLSPRNPPHSKTTRRQYLFIQAEKKINILEPSHETSPAWELVSVILKFWVEWNKKHHIEEMTLQWAGDAKHKGIFGTLNTNSPPKKQGNGVSHKYE